MVVRRRGGSFDRLRRGEELILLLLLLHSAADAVLDTNHRRVIYLEHGRTLLQDRALL